MAWITCPHCGFTQVPAIECAKCRRRLDSSRAAAEPPPAPRPEAGTSNRRLPPTPRAVLAIGGAAVLLLAVVLFLATRSARLPEAAVSVPATTPEPWSLDLTGRWHARTPTTIAGSPPRPALREVALETDASGNLVAASVVLTDPGRGGAGAGYLSVPDAPRRIRAIADALASAAGRGAPLPLDYIAFASWVPQRERLWRAVEGQRRRPEETTYLLVESLERDYLVQAGVNASGLLSYVYLSPEYAAGRGTDVLSGIIHPGSENSLRGFRNLIWDLSGAANFVSLQVDAAISGPAGSADRLVLRR
jgi:hypothetical protein